MLTSVRTSQAYVINGASITGARIDVLAILATNLTTIIALAMTLMSAKCTRARIMNFAWEIVRIRQALMRKKNSNLNLSRKISLEVLQTMRLKI